MSSDSIDQTEAEHVRAHVRVYLTVFASLAVLTVVTVAISYLRLPTTYAIMAAMVVASVKAGLVAAYFMHLLTEERVVHWVLLLTIAFFVTLMLIPVVTEVTNGPLWPPF